MLVNFVDYTEYVEVSSIWVKSDKATFQLLFDIFLSLYFIFDISIIMVKLKDRLPSTTTDHPVIVDLCFGVQLLQTFLSSSFTCSMIVGCLEYTQLY